MLIIHNQPINSSTLTFSPEYLLLANSEVVWRSKTFGLVDSIRVQGHIRSGIRKGHDLWFEMVCSSHNMVNSILTS